MYYQGVFICFVFYLLNLAVLSLVGFVCDIRLVLAARAFVINISFNISLNFGMY